jgi:hypothetical protein
LFHREIRFSPEVSGRTIGLTNRAILGRSSEWLIDDS